jgi:hypothetical protein
MMLRSFSTVAALMLSGLQQYLFTARALRVKHASCAESKAPTSTLLTLSW